MPGLGSTGLAMTADEFATMVGKVLQEIGWFLSLPITQVALGAVIGAAGSLTATYLALRNQRRTAGIDWLNAHLAKVEAILREFKQLQWGLDWADGKFVREAIANFEHLSDLYFKNTMLLSHGVRDELGLLVRRGRLALAILRMKDRDEETITQVIKVLERNEGELDDIKGLKGAELGVVLVDFMTAYRGVLLQIHDSAVVAIEELLDLSGLVNQR
jgi:hypothetical protein